MAETAGGLIGTLYLRLTADSSDLSKKVDDAEKKVVKSTDKMGKSANQLRNILGMLGAAFGTYKVIGFVQDVIHGTDELKKFSVELGISIDKLAGLKFAADKANVGEQFQMGMRKFAEAMREAQVEGSNMQLLFKNVMKIDPAQDIDKVFEGVVDQFSKWEDGVNKMGVAQELFGTRNARFVNLLNQGTAGIKKDTEELARVMGISYEDAAKAAEEYNDAITTLKAAFTGLALELIRQVLPHITEFTKWVTDAIPELHKMVSSTDTWVGSLVHLGKEVLPMVANAMKSFINTITGTNDVFVKFWESGFGKALDGTIQKGTDAVRDYRKEWEKLNKQAEAMRSNYQFEYLSVDSPPVLTPKRKSGGAAAPGYSISTGDFQGPFPPQASPAPNIEQMKANKAMLDKFNAEFGAKRGAAMGDIAGLSGIEGMTEQTHLLDERRKVEEQLEELRTIRATHFEMTEEQAEQHNARLNQMEELYAQKRKAIAYAEMKMRLQIGEQMFGDLASIAKAWAGEQSGIYKAMFAASKAFAIAEATVKIAQGIAAAAANPWPLNLAAMASVIAATASIVSSIQSVQLEFGGERALGGPVGPGKAFLVGEKGPELFAPAGSGTIIPNNRLTGGGETQVVINNHTDVTPVVTERQDGDKKVVEILFKQLETRLAGNVAQGTGLLTKAIENTYQMRRGNQ